MHNTVHTSWCPLVGGYRSLCVPCRSQQCAQCGLVSPQYGKPASRCWAYWCGGCLDGGQVAPAICYRVCRWHLGWSSGDMVTKHTDLTHTYTLTHPIHTIQPHIHHHTHTYIYIYMQTPMHTHPKRTYIYIYIYIYTQ